MKILYVEDEAQTREALAKYLNRHFGKIFTASDGLEGLEVFKEQQPDLVIADLYMPNMDGLEMIKEIKKNYPQTYVIVTSAVDEVGAIIEGVNTGVDKYLLKPINPEELLNMVNLFNDQLKKTRNLEIAFNSKDKKQMEDDIKKKIAAFLKSTTGKGPSGTDVFINFNKIEIKVFDILTIMERNIIDNIQNNVIIEEHRKIFYNVNEEAICNLVEEIIGFKTKFSGIEILLAEDINKIELEILESLEK